ncbi:heme o synthase [Microbacterium sp. BE35]|uniref:heme o synthase n=1 Tax=Microbacterium sp. BE35 TaxID=2817773 RepID=UPI00286CD598|nr:heme o synthase [Microbacterium sp. BE35]
MSAASPSNLRARVRAFVVLTKPRVMELLLVVTAPMMFLAGQSLPDPWLFLGTLIGGAMSAAAASSFNMYLDRDIDAQMQRTASRPLVTGEITPRAALVFSWTLAVMSTVWLWLLINAATAALSAFAIFFYVVVYTMILKRRTTQNIVWGGIAGCFPVLIGWAAVTGSVAWPSVALFLVVFFWTPAHYWPLSMRYSEDYRRVGVPMLGAVRGGRQVAGQVVVYTFATVACSLVLIPIGRMGLIYTAVAILAGGYFAAEAVFLLVASKDPRRQPRPMRVFHASNVYLTVLFVAVAIDSLVHVW